MCANFARVSVGYYFWVFESFLVVWHRQSFEFVRLVVISDQSRSCPGRAIQDQGEQRKTCTFTMAFTLVFGLGQNEVS